MMEQGLTPLSDRQIACLRRVAAGRSSKEIAREFGIAPSTVDNHIAIATRLLGCGSRVEAARRIDAGVQTSAPPIHVPDRWLPPLGGERNDQPAVVRLRQILVVALLAVAVSAGAIAVIAGVVRLFTR